MKKRNVLAVALACALCVCVTTGCSSGDSGDADGGSAQGAAGQEAADGGEAGSSASSSSSSGPDLTSEFDLSNVGFYGPEYEYNGGVDHTNVLYYFGWDETGDVQVYMSYSSAGSASAADVLQANIDQIVRENYLGIDRWDVSDDAELSVDDQGTTSIGGVEWAEAACSFGGTSFEGDALEETACYALATVIDPDEWDSFATDIWIIVMDNTEDQSVPQDELAEAAQAVAATLHKIEG